MKCQLTYLPLGTAEVTEKVDEVIDVIDGYDLSYRVGEMSTLVEGDREEVFNQRIPRWLCLGVKRKE